MPHHLRFFFEAGVTDTPLWPDDPDSPYGYPCELERLPISQAIRTELTRLCEHYQSSIDWEYPPGPSPWTQEQARLFDQQADTALQAVQRELGNGWTVDDQRQP